eukprot:5515577-Pyramimonas_sp.AAC.1
MQSALCMLCAPGKYTEHRDALICSWFSGPCLRSSLPASCRAGPLSLVHLIRDHAGASLGPVYVLDGAGLDIFSSRCAQTAGAGKQNRVLPDQGRLCGRASERGRRGILLHNNSGFVLR